MRIHSYVSIFAGVLFASTAVAQDSGNAISDGLAALLGKAQGGGQATGGTQDPPTSTATRPVDPSGLVDASAPEIIAGLLQKAGYRAEITVDNTGDPMIRSSAAGVDYSIYFYGCENAQNCLSLQFSTGYDLAQGTSFQVMNDWNSTQRFGFAYLDNESDPYINYDVNMAYGVTADNFLDSLALWEKILSNFQDHIEW